MTHFGKFWHRSGTICSKSYEVVRERFVRKLAKSLRKKIFCSKINFFNQMNRVLMIVNDSFEKWFDGSRMIHLEKIYKLHLEVWFELKKLTCMSFVNDSFESDSFVRKWFIRSIFGIFWDRLILKIIREFAITSFKTESCRSKTNCNIKTLSFWKRFFRSKLSNGWKKWFIVKSFAEDSFPVCFSSRSWMIRSENIIE